jgi:hypothetical protein
MARLVSLQFVTEPVRNDGEHIHHHLRSYTDRMGWEIVLTRDEIEAAAILGVIGHGFDLTGEQVDPGRRLGLVGVVDGEKSVGPHFAAALLPHLAHFAFRLFEQEARPARAVLLVALQLVARVTPSAIVAPSAVVAPASAVVGDVSTNSAGHPSAVTAGASGVTLHNWLLLLLLLLPRKQKENHINPPGLCSNSFRGVRSALFGRAHNNNNNNRLTGKV